MKLWGNENNTFATHARRVFLALLTYVLAPFLDLDIPAKQMVITLTPSID